MIVINRFSGDHAFLSNFYPCSVRLYGLHWPTVEHAFQAAKTTESSKREFIRRAPSPRDAKKLGRQLGLRPDWEDIKLAVMRTLVRNKFESPELRKMLLDTEDTPLEESNSWGDQFWGTDAATGEGANHLGRILMETRFEIQITEGLIP